MFTAQGYNMMDWNLNGIMKEEFAAKDVIRRFNQQHAQASGRLLLGVAWSAEPAEGMRR